MPLRNLLVIGFSAVISLACYAKAVHNRYAATLTAAMQLVEQDYLEEVSPRELFENAMNGMVAELDPYSAYFPPDDYREMEETLDQEFGGIGIVVEADPETHRLVVMSPLVDTPAYRAGMMAGDIILEIDGVSTEGMELKESVTLMRGPPGAPVRLKVLHPGQREPEEFTIERAVIPVESVLGDERRPDGAWSFFLADHPRIGYVRVTEFGKHTVDELRRTLRFEGHPVDALILDVRNNAGGLLTAAVATCDMFIDGGRIVSIRGRNGRIREQYDAHSHVLIPTDMPMVVLANRFSASASEIVAACLQDHHRALVVGERTWGKGTVQNIFELEGGKSALKLTTASYWRPSGKNIHRSRNAGEEEDWGVRPDKGCEVVLSDEQFEQVLRDRRERDIVRNGAADHPARSPSTAEESSGEKPPGEDTGGNAEEEKAPSIEDPQLQRAVQRLQEQLDDLDRVDAREEVGVGTRRPESPRAARPQ